MYFIGSTRFSLYNPKSKSWKISSSSEKKYLDELYSDERLKTRFDIFINKALPLYKEMSEGFFYKHIVQYSSYMPEIWKKKLKEETKGYDFIVLSESDKEVTPLPIASLLKGNKSGTLISFRVDDDDLLSKNYLHSLSNYSKEIYEGMLVSFGYGSIALYENGRFVDFRECHRRFLALGMASIGRYNAEKESYWLPQSGRHEKVDTVSPTIVDSREPMFIWTQSTSQDTKFGVSDANQNIYTLLNNYEPLINVKRLEELFPTISEEISISYRTGKPLISLNNIDFEKSSLNFPVKSKKKLLRYLVSYELIFNDISNMPEDTIRAMTLSFNFHRQPNSINGLSLSNSLEIGWYSYISINNLIGKKSFIISLDFPNSIESIVLSKYQVDKKSKFYIKELSVIEVGNDF